MPRIAQIKVTEKYSSANLSLVEADEELQVSSPLAGYSKQFPNSSLRRDV